MRRIIMCLAVIFCLHNCASAVDIITAFAGTGKPGDSGDGGPALAAQFLNPRGLAFDAAGNLYIVDEDAARIRKISRSGIITTVAGDGTPGFAGDGGPASASKIHDPQSLAIDSAGNLYFSDQGNLRIRLIDAAGNISTVAGNGTQAFTPDGPALTSGLDHVNSLAVSASGEIYFNQEHRIRKIAMGNIITIGGNDNSGFAGDGGPAINAQFNNPLITLDPAGNILVCDVDNHRIRKIDAISGIINTIAGNGTAGFSGDGGPAINAQLGSPGDGTAVDKAGNYYFGDYGASEREPRIRRIDVNGNISTVMGSGKGGSSGDGGAATKASTFGISAIAIDAAGDLYFSEENKVDVVGGDDDMVLHARIRKVSFNNPDFVENPDNGVSVQVASRNAGLLELAVNVESLNRATFDVSTFFDDIPTRASTSTGLRPSHQFIQSGIFIATTTATDQATGAPGGKMRKTLAIARAETGESAIIAAPPASRSIEAFNLKGKFVFNASKTDVVTFSGTIELPAGMDLSSQQVSVSAGNITDTINMDPKGKAILPSSQARVTKMSIKYPKPSAGTLTGAGQKAKVSFTLGLAGMVDAGFDTEGITAQARAQNPTAKSFPRAIQLALLVGGVTYEIKAPVAFKISSKGDVGQIQGRAGR